MEVYWKRREEGRERVLGTRVTEERQGGGGKREGGRDPPFKMEHSECAQELLLVTAAEDGYCQDPKGQADTDA